MKQQLPPPPVTAFGRVFSTPTTEAPPKQPIASRLMRALAAAPVFRDITIPGTEIRARITLLSISETNAVEADVERAIAALKAADESGAMAENERAARTLARAVFMLDDAGQPTSEPVDGHEGWSALGIERLTAVWLDYYDLRAEVDPSLENLTTADIDAIVLGVEKKNRPLLRSFGVRRLAIFLATTGSELLISRTPKSQPGGSSSGASSSKLPENAGEAT